MQINFTNTKTTDEAIESMVSLLQHFEQEYDVSHIESFSLDIRLLDNTGCEILLVDPETSEPFEVIDVQAEHVIPEPINHLQLVVDNTK